MTTLRDYILDCRCPNCGLSMQKQAPRKRSWYVRATPWIVPVVLLVALLSTIAGKWAEGAYFMALAVFLVVVDQ